MFLDIHDCAMLTVTMLATVKINYYYSDAHCYAQIIIITSTAD